MNKLDHKKDNFSGNHGETLPDVEPEAKAVAREAREIDNMFEGYEYKRGFCDMMNDQLYSE